MRAALKELGIEAEVEKVTDVKAMVQKGEMMTPAVIVDGAVKCQGTVPSVEEIKALLT